MLLTFSLNLLYYNVNIVLLKSAPRLWKRWCFVSIKAKRDHTKAVLFKGGSKMENKYVAIIAILMLVVGIAVGISYQNADKCSQYGIPKGTDNEQTVKINAVYSITYIADTATDTIGFNVVSIEDPTEKHLKSDVLLNKYDIFLYSDTKYHRSLDFAFMGYDQQGKPVFRILKNLQEKLDYEGEIFKSSGYTAKVIERSTGD